MSRRDARRGRTTSVDTMRRSPSQPAGRRPVLDIDSLAASAPPSRDGSPLTIPPSLLARADQSSS